MKVHIFHNYQHATHVVALSISESTDAAIARIIVSDPDRVQELFHDHNIAFGVSELMVVELREVATQFIKILSTLLMAEVNVHFSYPLLTRPNGRAALAMSAWGALRGGAGLVEVFVPENIYEIVAAAAPFESMVKPVKSYGDLLNEKIDVWGIGPGLGNENAREIMDLVQRTENPMVVDADALNIISTEVSILKNCRGPRLLTPHPGEMKRLAGDRKISRAELTKNFTAEFPVTLLLKGSRTIVAENGKPISYNTTGNPGMIRAIHFLALQRSTMIAPGISNKT